MTSPRSFREAFTEDPADVKDRARIVGERDSARRIAVELENRIEKALHEADRLTFNLFAADLFDKAARTVLSDCSTALVAALTGGGDE